jgi:hypothetical protein
MTYSIYSIDWFNYPFIFGLFYIVGWHPSFLVIEKRYFIRGLICTIWLKKFYLIFFLKTILFFTPLSICFNSIASVNLQWLVEIIIMCIYKRANFFTIVAVAFKNLVLVIC